MIYKPRTVTPHLGRVLYVCSGRSVNSQNPGRKIRSIVDCWGSFGAEVRLLCGDDHLGKTLAPGAAPVPPSRPPLWKRLSPIQPLINTLSEARDISHDNDFKKLIEAAVREFQPTLIWNRSYRLHLSALEVAQSADIPFVLEWKDHLVPYSLSLNYRRAIAEEHRKNREARFIVVESHKLKQDLGAAGVTEDKILVAHNAVDGAKFSKDPVARKTFRAKLGIKDRDVLAGYLGSYAFYHDARRLVFAAGIIAKQNSNVRIVMAGDGPGKADCIDLMSDLGLDESRLIFMPKLPASEVPGFLSALDIAVLPGSTDIICPIKIAEYMALGLPTVLPDYSCNREIVEPGVSGILFQPHNQEALAEALLQLAHDEPLRRRLGLRAADRVRRCFSWESTWGQALMEINARLAGVLE